MKKNKGIIIILTIIIFFLFVWKVYPLLVKSSEKKELIFNIKNSNIEVKIGETSKIDYEINDDTIIKWKSDNNDVVSINNGIITGKGYGSTIIHGTIIKDDTIIKKDCHVSTYTGSKDRVLQEIIVPDGELFISKGAEYYLEYSLNPLDAYITSIEFSSINDDVATFSDGIVRGNNIGSTNIVITINKNIIKTIRVNVVDKKISPTFSNMIESIKVDEDNISIKLNETKEIIYSVVPSASFIEGVEWESSNPKIVTIDDGIITGTGPGEATIKLKINNIIKYINVSVSVPVNGIKLLSNPKIVMKVGQKETIRFNIIPDNATNKELKYSNSNPSIANINENGIITANKEGKGVITITTVDGKYSTSISYIINPLKGLINNAGDIWGYTSPIDKVPERADKAFFQKLARNGKGTLSGNKYVYNSGKLTYTYDISASRLTVNNFDVLMRIYYPPGVDLSMVNTFAFGNGTSGAGFIDLFNALEKDKSKMKTSGIIILIATKDGRKFYKEEFIYATNFVKSIVDQKSGVKNAVGGYSGSGEAAAAAANDGNYDRLLIYNSYFYFKSDTKLKNKEIIVYAANEDKLAQYTGYTVYDMKNAGFTNVTIVSNNSKFTGYGSYALVVNPGSQMGSGHGYVNIPPTHIFSYACR